MNVFLENDSDLIVIKHVSLYKIGVLARLY